MATPEELILKQGFFAQEFHMASEKSDPKATRIEISDGLLELSEHFCSCFENSGVCSDGIAYSMKTVPVESTMTYLSEILEKDIDNKYFLTGDTLKQWKYMKGSKAED